MAEMSFFWTTNAAGAGDQVASYTQAQLAIAHAIIAACSGFEGVAPGYSSELACSDGGANTVDVAAGGAVVDGIPYSNSAAENVNVPSAAGGGNTRIDRIVARVSWAGFDVAITRIAGTDAATPAAPAITQTAGTTYDIMLCQVLVDTAGAVTVTDERTWAITEVDDSTIENNAGQLRVKALGIDTGQLAADAVTGAKIVDDAVDSEHIAAGAVDLAHMSVNSVNSDQYVDGSIDAVHLATDAVTTAKILAANVTVAKMAANSVDSAQYVDGSIDSAHLAANSVTAGKIADGAVDITASLANDIVDDTKVGNRVPQFYRRQGGSATVWNTGGTTAYTPTAVRMQAGAVATDGSGNVTITFPVAFSYTPLVLASIGSNSLGAGVHQVSVSSTQVVFKTFQTSDGNNYGVATVHWLAIGPE